MLQHWQFTLPCVLFQLLPSLPNVLIQLLVADISKVFLQVPQVTNMTAVCKYLPKIFEKWLRRVCCTKISHCTSTAPHSPFMERPTTFQVNNPPATVVAMPVECGLPWASQIGSKPRGMHSSFANRWFCQ